MYVKRQGFTILDKETLSNAVKKVSYKSSWFFSPNAKRATQSQTGLYLLSEVIQWTYFDEQFEKFYSKEGRPAHSIRLMTSLLILKHLYSLSDEILVEQQWEMNPYFQYFGGMRLVQWGQPCAVSDLVHFRNRIGKQGIEKILKHSIEFRKLNK